MKRILTVVFLILLVFTRVYNIDHTARFTQDESRDLVHMRQIVVDHKLTLVGPISNDNNKVFGSLTYYMVLPFVILLRFSPISPVYGTAFWGILTALLLVGITYKLHRKMLIVVIPLVLTWHPLLETSRWAWNPHYVVFWISLGILLSLWKRPFAYLAAGVALALAFHNHYIALFATGAFIAAEGFTLIRSKQLPTLAALVGGYILPFLPFLAFDLLHPPGLFITTYLLGGNTPQTSAFTLMSAVQRIGQAISITLPYLAPVPVVPVILGILLLGLLILDLKERSRHLIWAIPVIVQLLTTIILVHFETRYFLPALPFLFVWLIAPRLNVANYVSKIAMVIILLASFFTVYPELTQTKVPPDIYSLTEATKIMAATIKNPENKIKNANVAVLSAPDTDPLASKYRDALSLYDIHLKTSGQYDTSENLFVVSPAGEAQLREDGDYAMKPFKESKLRQVSTIPHSPWKVYWFAFE